MPNKYKSCFLNLTTTQVKAIVDSYKTKSQAAVCNEFNITRYALLRIIKDHGIQRSKYGDERNQMVSDSIKRTLLANPEIVEKRILLHTGSKRSEKSKRKMQLSAWNRMKNNPKNYVSKIETSFGLFLEKKLGLSVVKQYRVNGKPFDFLIEGKILVEFDGPHHYQPDYYLWKNDKDGFQKQQLRDNLRWDIAKKSGLNLIVVKHCDVNRNGHPKGDFLHYLMGALNYECP